MTQLKELIDYLEEIAPPHLQENYDNSGLIVGDPEMVVMGVMTCLDSTEEVLDEAISKGCNVIVAHHPIVFKGLKSLTGSTYVERVVIKAIKSDLAIYAIHTNLDNVYYNGVNSRIAKKLGLVHTAILAPKLTSTPEVPVGAGMIGKLVKPMEEATFLAFLKKQMKASCIKHTAFRQRPIEKVALCGGAGGFLLRHAINQEADIFITSDYRYHDFFDADDKIIIADIGHFESEQFTSNLLAELISEKFCNFVVIFTTTCTNPVYYYFK